MDIMQRNKGNGRITSIEILDQINRFRVQEDKNLLRHDTLRNIIKDEFEEEILIQNILEKSVDSGGRPFKIYDMSFEQGKQILLRESKFVRKAVVKYIERLQKEIEKPKSELELIIQSAQEIQRVEKKVEALENKFDSVVTLESGKQRIIQKAVAKRVFYRLWEISGTAKRYEQELRTLEAIEEMKKWENKKENKIIKRKMFSNLYRELKNKFGVASYKDIKVVQFDDAIKWINNWIEDADLI